jgi:GT2 family glycosyltransferase
MDYLKIKTSTDMQIVELSIIIVNYNTRMLLENCLKSIAKFLTDVIHEIIIVDNDSKDDSKEWLQQFIQSTDNVNVIFSDSNLGFGKANNEGLKVATGKYVLFLNSDTYLIDSSITSVISWIKTDESCFGAGCLLLNPDKSFGVSYGNFPELHTVFLEVISNRYCQLRGIVPKKENIIKKIDFPCGAFFLVKKDILDKIGYFDERFFLYYEETDLAKRAKKSGYSTYYYGHTKIVHVGGASENRRSSFITGMNFTSWSKYLHKHQGKLASYIVKQMLKSYFYIKIFYAVVLKKRAVYELFREELTGLENGWLP